MSKKIDLSILQPFVALEQCPWGSILRLSDDVLSMAFSAEALRAFQSLLKDQEHHSDKPLALWAGKRSFAPEQCDAFLSRLRDLNGQHTDSNFFPMLLSTVAMVREENLLGQLIRWLRSVKRPVIMVFQGDVELPFLGIGLACDYRVATSETTFCNQSRDLDLPLGSGLLHFLPAYVGLGRANALATRATQVSAASAFKWGLLDEVVMPSELEPAVQTLAEEVSVFSPETLGTIKQLLNHHLPDFDTYFACEAKGMEEALARKPWENLRDQGTRDAPLQG
jgi:1,4-dihydroxy-2-naphthoyl-CoA synthase